MLFQQRFWAGLADGSVTVAFRRWRRPSVKAGGTLKSPVGLLGIDAVTAIDDDDITDADAVRAGHASRQELLDELARRPVGQLYRIEFQYVGDDPRLAMGDDDHLDAAALEQVRARLHRFDRASVVGPWTRETLRLIDHHPETVARELAAMAGRERDAFKTRRPQTQGARPHPQPAGRLPPVPARRHRPPRPGLSLPPAPTRRPSRRLPLSML